MSVCLSVMCSVRLIFRHMLLVSAGCALQVEMQPLQSMPNATLLCVSTVNKSFFLRL